jgi:hypothetical protein
MEHDDEQQQTDMSHLLCADRRQLNKARSMQALKRYLNRSSWQYHSFFKACIAGEY